LGATKRICVAHDRDSVFSCELCGLASMLRY
jgi:hypothetical protein